MQRGGDQEPVLIKCLDTKVSEMANMLEFNKHGLERRKASEVEMSKIKSPKNICQNNGKYGI